MMSLWRGWVLRWPAAGLGLVLCVGCGAPRGHAARAAAAQQVGSAGRVPTGPEHRWAVYESPDGSFRVDLPGDPLVRPEEVGPEVDRAAAGSVESTAAGCKLRVRFRDVAPQRPPPSSDPEELRHALAATFAHPGLRVVSDRVVQVGAYRGLQLRFQWTASGRRFELWALTLVVGRRIYLLSARPLRARPPSDFAAVARRFLSSFTPSSMTSAQPSTSPQESSAPPASSAPGE